MKLVLSCEHGGNQVPKKFQSLFEGHDALLQSHRGWDPGALEISQQLAQHFNVPLTYCEITRLLIELNRSEGHPQHFSILSNQLDSYQKNELITEIYRPYRNKVESLIKNGIETGGFALHVSVHTFTPVLDGMVRQADIGILFDPDRKPESDLAEEWIESLNRISDFHCKANYPYLGIDDGLTTYLRSRFSAEEYAGLELEVNQKLISIPEKKNLVIETIIKTLRKILS